MGDWMRGGLLRLAIVVLLASFAVGIGAVSAEPIRVTFVHFNDVYELTRAAGKGGLEQAATLIRVERAKNINTIVTFGGDLLSPSFMSGLTQGSQMIDMLNSLGVDYAALGNHEFDFGAAILRQRMAESQFVWLATTVRDDDGAPFGGGVATAIRRVGPYTIGFFSVLALDTAGRSSPGAHVNFLSPIVAAGEAVKALRAHGVDVVVALTHEPVADDKALIDQVPGIDLVLGGDDHVPMTAEEHGIPIVKAGHDVEALAFVDMSIDRQDGQIKVTATPRLVATLGVKANARLAAKIKTYDDEFDRQLDLPVATISGELDSRQDVARGAESSMADVIADALQAGTKADIAIINGGGVRGDRVYPAGTQLIRKDIQRELPFANTVVVIELSGADILAALENGVSKVADKAGRFPQVAGVAFVFDPGKPAGKRIVSVTVAGVPLDPKKVYKVATNEFMANGGDGYDMMTKAKRVDGANDGRLLTQVVSDYLAAEGTVPAPDGGRIRQAQ
jgi:2',3'-cyclic-nucleotide 2'-phosphodiesterase (5'-nucleotidase family)